MALFLLIGVFVLEVSTECRFGAAGLSVDRAGAGTLGRGCLEFETVAKGVPTLQTQHETQVESNSGVWYAFTLVLPRQITCFTSVLEVQPSGSAAAYQP
jgi:hypothetical protein